MKKVLFFTTVMTVLAMTQTGIMAKTEIGDIEIKGNLITITGTADLADEYVTMVVRNNETNQLMTVAQKKTEDDKHFEIEFEMPSVFENNHTDGEYKVTINLNKSNADKDVRTFSYVRGEIRTSLFDIIKTKVSADIVTLIASDEIYVKALEVEGIYAERFVALDAQTQRQIMESALADKDMTNAELKDVTSDINMYISFYELKNGVNISENLEEINCVFEGKAYSDMETDEKAYISEGIKNAGINDYNDFLDKYEELSVLCQINFARYSEMDELMQKYETQIGLDVFDSYTRYRSLLPVQKQNVQEGIVSELGTAVYSYEEFRNVLKNRVNLVVSQAVIITGGGNSGGNSGGGSSSSKNMFASAQVPTNTVLRADVEVAEETFSDIDNVAWAKDAILYLAEKGIVSGRGDKKFAPDELVTREEFVKMIVSAAGVYDENAKCDFSDVAEGSWYASYVASAVNNGLVSGQSETVFGVGKPITRQDVCVISAKLLDVKADDVLSYDDADEISEYAKEGVMKLSSCGIVSGMGDNKFMPQMTCTRAQAAKIIYGIIERR